MRRLKHRLRSTDVVLFTDWTLLRLFPPLRAMWAAIGTQAQVCITGQNARRVLFGTLNLRTAHRTVLITRGVGVRAVRAFLRAVRRAYRRAGTIWPDVAVAAILAGLGLSSGRIVIRHAWGELRPSSNA